MTVRHGASRPTSGIDGYVTKPFRIAQVLFTVVDEVSGPLSVA